MTPRLGAEINKKNRCLIQTDGDIEAALRLEEPVYPLPDLRQPFDDPFHGHQDTSVGRGLAGPAGQLTAEVATEEASHWLDVVGVEHPAKVVMHLKVGVARGRRLVHRTDHVRTVNNTLSYSLLFTVYVSHSSSGALTLVAEWQEGHRACKK